jgi:hypothetical protein
MDERFADGSAYWFWSSEGEIVGKKEDAPKPFILSTDLYTFAPWISVIMVVFVP